MAAENEEKNDETVGEDDGTDEAAEGETAEADETSGSDSDAPAKDDEDDAGEDSDDESDEGDESDDGEDDSGESDEAGDEEGDDDAEDRAAAPKARRKGGKRRRAGKTPGQRLAEAKAKKAKRKQQERGRGAEAVESKVLERAERASAWARGYRAYIWGAIAAVILMVAGVIYYTEAQAEERKQASDELWSAVEAAGAPIIGEDDEPLEDEDLETFPTLEERNEAALSRFSNVRSEHAGTDLAIWARLGEGGSLLSLERWDEAREAFEAALSEGGDDTMVAWRALEGIAFSYEAEENWEQAESRYSELSETAGQGPIRDMAQFHLARLYLAQGDEARGEEKLGELVERLRGATEEEDVDEGPELDFLLNQVELRLMELDSSLVRARPSPTGFGGGGDFGGGGGGATGTGGGSDLTPEQLQQLIEQFQKQQGGGGGGE